ncbi:MAG: ThuA domain-containing protein [Flammeovirgaceae bacterium]|nr:ThuA domain-containing protein [Flammeovirgaceae bacterium]
MKNIWILLLMTIVVACNSVEKQETQKPKLKALILDGQNNHYIWPKSTMIMKSYFEETGLFDVAINRADSVWLGNKYNQSREVPLEGYLKEFPLESPPKGISENPVQTSNFDLDFSQYDLIISNLGENSAYWPEATKRKFEQYMQNGGGLVIIHAADNAWGDWTEFNKMIGLGAWGGRDSLTGPYVYYDEEGEIQKDPTEGHCATHGLEHEYVVTTRAPEHPIMKGLPTDWLHAQDELYDRMRGPFENATILATAYSDVEKNEQPWEPSHKGTGWNVATLMAINYGKGRIFHSTLGHFDYSMECIGFKTTLQRGAEWAATGKVTQEVPENFPTKDKTASVVFKKD